MLSILELVYTNVRCLLQWLLGYLQKSMYVRVIVISVQDSLLRIYFTVQLSHSDISLHIGTYEPMFLSTTHKSINIFQKLYFSILKHLRKLDTQYKHYKVAGSTITFFRVFYLGIEKSHALQSQKRWQIFWNKSISINYVTI